MSASTHCNELPGQGRERAARLAAVREGIDGPLERVTGMSPAELKRLADLLDEAARRLADAERRIDAIEAARVTRCPQGQSAGLPPCPAGAAHPEALIPAWQTPGLAQAQPAV